MLAAGECDAKGQLLPGVTWREALAQQRPVGGDAILVPQWPT